MLVILQESLVLAQVVQQDGESVCDCIEPCTAMAEARALSLEKHWTERVQSLEDTFRKDREALEAAHREELNALQAAVLVSVDARKKLEESLQQANSLRLEHEHVLDHFQEHLERNTRSCQVAHDSVASLQVQKDKLTTEYSQLQRHVKLLIQEKQRLQQSNKELTQDLDEYKKNVRILINKNFENSRDLLHSHERLRELDNEYFRINTKLIWRDAQAMLEQVNLYGVWNYVYGWVSPLFEFAVQVLLGIWSNNAAWIDDMNSVNVSHKLQVQPILEHRIYSIQGHLVESRRKVLDSLADFIQYRSQSILSYVSSLEGASKSRTALVRALEYSERQSEKVARILERMLCIFASFWLVAGFVAWRRHRSR